MVACGSRVGLRRYCTLLGEAGVTLTEDDPWQQYWSFEVYSWVTVPSTAACLRPDCPPAGRGLSHPVRYKLNPRGALTFWCTGPWRSCTGRR
jgi:hypothetical protein